MFINLSTEPAKRGTRPPASDAELYFYCQFFTLWRLCRFARCRRDRRCRGKPRECLARWLPFVPDPVQRFVVGFYSMKAAGIPSKELESCYRDEIYASQEWLAALTRASGPASTPGRPPERPAEAVDRAVGALKNSAAGTRQDGATR